MAIGQRDWTWYLTPWELQERWFNPGEVPARYFTVKDRRGKETWQSHFLLACKRP